MASQLLSVGGATTVAGTNVITATAGKQTIIIGGTVANVDVTNKATHFVSITLTRGATVVNLIKDAPIPYGGSLKMPKTILVAGDVLNIKASTASVLEHQLNYVEKD